jgi:DNA-binding NarL/FixJ family response regulator
MSCSPVVPFSKSPEKISLLASDTTPIGCELLAEALTRADFNVLRWASSSEDVVVGVKECTVDIVLINAALGDGPLAGFSALRQIHFACPHVKPVIMLERPNAELITTAFRGGARGVFPRAEPFGSLCKCIRAVHEGQIWASSRDLQYLLEALASAAPLRPVNVNGARLLTVREEQVINLVAQGLTNREIGKKLSLSESTVKNYLFRVFDKLGVSSRVELVLYSMHNHQAS